MDTITVAANNNPQKVSKDSSNNKLISSLIVIAIAILFFCVFPGSFLFIFITLGIIYASYYANYNSQRKVELDNAARIEAIKTSFEEIRKAARAECEQVNETILLTPQALRRQHDLQDMQDACNKVARDNAVQSVEAQFELVNGLNKFVQDIMSMKQEDPLGNNNPQDTFDQGQESFESAPTFDQDDEDFNCVPI